MPQCNCRWGSYGPYANAFLLYEIPVRPENHLDKVLQSVKNKSYNGRIPRCQGALPSVLIIPLYAPLLLPRLLFISFIQIEGYDLPPAMVKIYQKTAGAVGVEDKSPFYVCLCVVVVSSALLLATCSCSSGAKGTVGRKKKKVPAKKKKAKAKSKSVSVASNGSVHKNGDVSGSGTSKSGGSDKQTVVPMANGSAPRGLPAKVPKNAGVRGVVDADYAGGGGAGVDSAPATAAVSSKGDASKPAKKPAATKSHKDSGKSAGDDPPVITVRYRRQSLGREGGGMDCASKRPSFVD